MRVGCAVQTKLVQNCKNAREAGFARILVAATISIFCHLFIYIYIGILFRPSWFKLETPLPSCWSLSPSDASSSSEYSPNAALSYSSGSVIASLNPITTGGGGTKCPRRRLFDAVLSVRKIQSSNLVTFPQISYTD